MRATLLLLVLTLAICAAGEPEPCLRDTVALTYIQESPGQPPIGFDAVAIRSLFRGAAAQSGGCLDLRQAIWFTPPRGEPADLALTCGPLLLTGDEDEQVTRHSALVHQQAPCPDRPRRTCTTEIPVTWEAVTTTMTATATMPATLTRRDGTVITDAPVSATRSESFTWARAISAGGALVLPDDLTTLPDEQAAFEQRYSLMGAAARAVGDALAADLVAQRHPPAAAP